MELQERINIIKQGAEIAQKNGALTLEEAYYTKQALDALTNNVSHKAAIDILTKIITTGQKKGVYSLKDSYLLYVALDNIESTIPAPTPTAAAPQEEPEKRKVQKKESKSLSFFLFNQTSMILTFHYTSCLNPLLVFSLLQLFL